MNSFEILTIILSAFSVLIIPALVLLVNIAARSARNEQRLTEVIEDVKQLAGDSDRRLRWLEENFWRRR